MNSEQVKGCATIIDAVVAQLSTRVRVSSAQTFEDVAIHVPRSTFAGGPNAVEYEAIEALRNILDAAIECEIERLREQAKDLGHEITDKEIADLEARLAQAARTHAAAVGSFYQARTGHVRLSPEEQAEAVAKYPDHTLHKALSLYAIEKSRAPQLSVVGS